MAGSIIMVTLIQTVMLSVSVPFLLVRLTVTVPLPSSVVKVVASNSMVTSGAMYCISNLVNYIAKLLIKSNNKYM